MANIQIGKYKRPGIFIEEYDKSIVVSPNVEAPIPNLVVGFSKKGVFNQPILLNNLSDMATYGQIDRNLERRGSYFHRTISKMLESGPVLALNLLMTDDELDKIQYKSLSTSSGSQNDVIRTDSYRKFFDTTGFWKRDTESFVDLTKNNAGYNERAFNITNMSDKPISVFVFKSSMTGFDRTILEWYGSEENMPPYLNKQDYASDYMVDVLVVGGNWSNYQELAVDPRWSQYFNTSGLLKNRVREFSNDRNVSTLAYYEGLSIIPYFRDLEGRNIFIETAINRDTDRTGLYCAFNVDLVEQNFYNGMLDLNGNTIVGENATSINFLSYNETIAESVDIVQTPLDLPGNITALYGDSGMRTDSFHAYGATPSTSGIIENTERTGYFAEGYVYGVDLDGTSATFSAISFDYNVSSAAYAVIGGEQVAIDNGTPTLTISQGDFPAGSATFSYYVASVVTADGLLTLKKTKAPDTKPTVLASDIVLGYVYFDVAPSTGEFHNVDFTNVTINGGGFIDLDYGNDYDITETAVGSLKVEFLGTNVSADVTDYETYRKFKMFNNLVAVLDTPRINRMAMLGDYNYSKLSLENASITDIVTSTNLNKSFILNTGVVDFDSSDILDGGFIVLYTEDNELILGSDSMVTKQGLATSSEGVVGKFSTLYRNYYDGLVNTRDTFFTNRLYVDGDNNTNNIATNLDSINVTFFEGSDLGATSSYNGYNYIIFNSTAYNINTEVEFVAGEKIQFPSSDLNVGAFTIASDEVSALDAVSLASELGFGSNNYAYQVLETVVSESLTSVNKIYDFDEKVYMQFYLDTDSNLNLQFKNSDLSENLSINTESNISLSVESRVSNYKQTLEIEVPSGYVRSQNKVLVKADRYTEVKVGDFLEAYVDATELEAGEVPRKLTRILSKRQWSGDASYAEITCDARIKTYDFGGDLQTFRYLSVDNYASTYKAIVMNGFRLREASIPDGTEERQNEILNLIAKGTPLFRALTNKDSIDFRYLIDSFGLGLVENSKQQLADLCGERLDVFGFLNAPSIKQMKNSVSPSFVDANGIINSEYIAAGGNIEANPRFLYSFAEGAGVTTVGYFTPYLQINDGGRILEVPPAAYVASTYMRKRTSNITAITPWTIAAGVTNGRVTGIVGLETEFDYIDIENLNQAKFNPIVTKRNRGYAIETENTAQTEYNSALSQIHVREVLIELERELSAMLLEYQWKFNTADIRAEIKLRADVICDTFVSKNGLYAYFNKMDEENNTPELIDSQIGVLDTYVEPIKGMAVIVNNITILRTGAISSNGFIES